MLGLWIWIASPNLIYHEENGWPIRQTVFFQDSPFFSDNRWQLLPHHFSRKTCGLQTRPGRRSTKPAEICVKKKSPAAKGGYGSWWHMEKSKGIGSTKIFLGSLAMHLLAICRCLGFRVYLKLSELTLLGLRQSRDFQDFFPDVSNLKWCWFCGCKNIIVPRKKSRTISLNTLKVQENCFFWLDIFVWQRFSLLRFFGS